MEQISTLFVGTFTTLLAIVNPLDALPIFLKLMEGNDDREHLQVARHSCLYATLLLFFFLVFGTAMLKIFDVPLSMVRIVGGIVLMRIGFSLFLPSASNEVIPSGSQQAGQGKNVAFVPLAMPIMAGPGAMATIIGMSSLVKHPFVNFSSMAAICGAIAATMLVVYIILAYARRILRRIGEQGVDAATRIVGFFVSAMGMGLIFHGLLEVMQQYGMVHKP